MALRGINPESIQKRLKVFFYGGAGVGKTTTSIQFPKPYIIDTERGAENSQYIEMLKKHEGAIFQTSDFDELLKEVMALLTEKHDFKTLIIDPLTIVYNDLIEKCSIQFGTEFGRHYNEANKKMKRLLALLIRLDMNVIITSHSKNEYGKDMTVLGQTYDCYKKLDYLFDLVLEVKVRGSERTAIVRKSRIDTFPVDSNFKFSYDEIADRYGRQTLERDVTPEVLATEEQLLELNQLIQLHKITEITIYQWLTKAGCSSLEELNQDIITKLLNYLRAKV